QAGAAAADARPVSVLAIFDRRPDEPAEIQRVTAGLRAATAGLTVQVQPVKQLLLADADARSSRFTALFRGFGLFSVLGGLLLVVLTFLMLARDRARSMGILRANGLRRSRHVAALSLEGWLYATAGAAIGGIVGLGIGVVVVFVARDVFATQPVGRVDLVFAARPTSVAIGCAVGFLASLAVVVSAAVADSRRNIVRMIKGLADPPHATDPRLRRRIGGGLIAAGVAMFTGGLVAANGVATVIGPAIAGVGFVLVVATQARTRLAASGVAVAVFIWSSLVITVVRGAFRGLGAAVIATEGSVMVACAAALVTVNHAAVTRRWTDPPTRRGLSFAIGVAYSRTAPKRTALIVSMYAVTIFTLALLVTVGQLYRHDVDALARRLGGAAAVEVTSDATRPVPVRDVAQMPGVTRVTTTRSINAQLQDGPTTAPIPVAVVGFDDSFIGHGSPPLVGRSDLSLFGRVARDPTTVIVGADLRADLPSGLPGTSLRVGDRVELRDPLTGTARTLTVAGLALATRWAGADHVYAAAAVADELAGGTAPTNLLYVEAAGTNNDVLAAIIDGTHLPNGAYARSFRTLAVDTLSAQRQFLDVGAGYATVGLLADLAGIGVLMVDRVRARRRQIAVMRALGFQAGTLRRALRVEAAVIAAEGILAGLVTAVILAWRLGASGALGQHLAFSVPIGALCALAAAVVAASIVATNVPARRAGRLRPAGALRSDE
ncbi:MAG TPA: FtsX-like permease family protein, partial [Acidimicrobiia bacterium]|nr:FtsX-like permease family protein [Acidimicrobiia bacterium]